MRIAVALLLALSFTSLAYSQGFAYNLAVEADATIIDCPEGYDEMGDIPVESMDCMLLGGSKETAKSIIDVIVMTWDDTEPVTPWERLSGSDVRGFYDAGARYAVNVGESQLGTEVWVYTIGQ